MAKVDSQEVEVLTYEGVLTDARITDEGATLFLEPHVHWDHDLEVEVKSLYEFNISLELTKVQDDYLGFTEINSETNNIVWDFYQNLFLVHYYVDAKQRNIPLKFINQGKTEWDG